MTAHAHDAAVDALIRRVADEIVLPRFRHLAIGEIEEKAPDDLVTIADRESEVALTAGLLALDADARVIGEEAVAADASVLDGIATGRVWIVDPIDGTNNFASGRSPFGIMIALVEDGVAQAAWLFDPIAGRMCHATLGGGATIDGVRVTARGTGHDLPLTALSTYFMTADQRTDFTARAAGTLTLVDIPRCAAEQYPRIVLGQNDAALFERTHPWDHIAGALFVSEAGGVAKRPDGSAYRVGDDRRGLLVASTPALWDAIAALLFG